MMTLWMTKPRRRFKHILPNVEQQGEVEEEERAEEEETNEEREGEITAR